MRRGLWFVAGAGAGIWAMIRGRRAAEALTIDGMQDRLNGLAVGVRMFRDEVAQGKAEAEIGLRERFALAPHGVKELASGAQAAEASRLVASAPRTSATKDDNEEEGSSGGHR